MVKTILNFLKLGNGNFLSYDKKTIKIVDSLPSGVFKVELLTEIPKKANRSTQQNRYYWAVVLGEMVRAVDDSYTTEQFHDMLKGLYFGYTPLGNSHIIGGSTTKLDTKEMENYLKMCREWAFENLNCSIQLPNEAGFDYDI